MDTPRWKLNLVYDVLLVFSRDAAIGIFVLMQMLQDDFVTSIGGAQPSDAEIVVCADTSVSATGGTCNVPGAPGIAVPLPEWMVDQPSTQRETWGILPVTWIYFSLAVIPVGAEICFVFDNQGSSKLFYKGSPVLLLQHLSMALFFLLLVCQAFSSVSNLGMLYSRNGCGGRPPGKGG